MPAADQNETDLAKEPHYALWHNLNVPHLGAKSNHLPEYNSWSNRCVQKIVGTLERIKVVC